MGRIRNGDRKRKERGLPVGPDGTSASDVVTVRVRDLRAVFTLQEGDWQLWHHKSTRRVLKIMIKCLCF